MEVNNVSKRLEAVISYFNKNKNSFSKAIGMPSNVTIGRIVNEDRKPSFEVLSKINEVFPEININWLVSGKGEMLSSIAISNSDPSGLSDIELIKHLLDRNDQLINNETFRDYIRMTMELIMADDEREKKNKALDELRQIAIQKHQKG